MRRVPGPLLLALLGAVSSGCASDPDPSVVRPVLVTQSVGDDPDDPAIWLHPTDGSRSLIIGTNKTAAPAGALVVFGLDGKIRQTIAGLDRPNNVDVEYGFRLDNRDVDLVVATERLQHRLRVFVVDVATGTLTDAGAIPVLAGQTGAMSEPMGIALYRRAADQAVFAIVAPKLGGPTDYLWQYQLEDDTRGRVTGRLVRRFGAFSQQGTEAGDPGEIEAVVVDDPLGYVYYSDERFGIRKYPADPAREDASRELAVIGREGYAGDREGLAVFARPDGSGFLISTDQLPDGTVFRLYRREGRPGAPHDQAEVVREVRTTADDTDGIEVASIALPGFPAGLLVAMNSGPRNFALFSWDAVAPAGKSR